MTIDKEKLKDLAGQSALEPKWYEAGSHGLKNVSHLHDRKFIAAASPATVLALLAEIERLESEAMHTAAGAQSDREQRDQLKAENEALRKDAERYRFVRKTWCPDWPSEKADAQIDAAMAKEVSHG
jgi:FtsZ-binding cell division protein ZapB